MKMHEGEEFRNVHVKGLEPLKDVQVSNYGRVKRGYFILNKNKRYNKDGYEIVFIKELGHDTLLHRIIADTFHPEQHTEERNVVDHIDGDKLNNHADNLEWVTVSTNTQRYFDSLDFNEKKRRNAASNVLAVNYKTQFSTIYPTINAAAEATGVSSQHISQIIRGTRDGAKGFKFFKLGSIEGIKDTMKDGIEAGLNRDLGYYAQATFENYTVRVSDRELDRSTKDELIEDVKLIQSVIEERLHAGDKDED